MSHYKTLLELVSAFLDIRVHRDKPSSWWLNEFLAHYGQEDDLRVFNSKLAKYVKCKSTIKVAMLFKQWRFHFPSEIDNLINMMDTQMLLRVLRTRLQKT